MPPRDGTGAIDDMDNMASTFAPSLYPFVDGNADIARYLHGHGLDSGIAILAFGSYDALHAVFPCRRPSRRTCGCSS